VPIHEIAERWIGKYERHRLQALSDLKKGLEENRTRKANDMKKTNQVYTTFIRTTPKKLWAAITKPEFTAPVLGRARECLRLEEGLEMGTHHQENEAWITGKVLECNPPKRLVLTWADPDDLADKSRVTLKSRRLKTRCA